LYAPEGVPEGKTFCSSRIHKLGFNLQKAVKSKKFFQQEMNGPQSSVHEIDEIEIRIFF
jgi:hypothetical protein